MNAIRELDLKLLSNCIHQRWLLCCPLFGYHFSRNRVDLWSGDRISPGIGSVAGGTNGLAPTLDHLLDLKKEVAVDNADVASCGYLTNAKVEAVLAKAKDSQDQYLLSPYGTELGRSQIAGRRFEVSNNVPSDLTKGTGSNLSAVIYGNFADLLIGLYGTLEILVDPYTDFAKGTTGIRALQSIDIAVRHAQSFAAMQDAIA